MRLIVEYLGDEKKLEPLTEATSDGSKAMYLQGPFMMFNEQNKNGRVYPKHIMEKEVNRYFNEVVKNGKAYGELNHPDSRSINLDRVCHLIKELHIEKDNHVYGKSRITETPKGLIIKGLLESGANLGVSSRGLGSLKENNGIMEVQNDFHLVTAADVVADPSAPKAFVRGIMEGVEYFYDEKIGDYIGVRVDEIKKEVHNTPIKRLDEEKMLDIFENFMTYINNQPKKTDTFSDRLENFKKGLK